MKPNGMGRIEQINKTCPYTGHTMLHDERKQQTAVRDRQKTERRGIEEERRRGQLTTHISELGGYPLKHKTYVLKSILEEYNIRCSWIGPTQFNSEFTAVITVYDLHQQTSRTKRANCPSRPSPTPDILTASASAFSREARAPATTDSMTATHRCLSGKLGAMKQIDCPGQHGVWQRDSSFRT